MAMHELEATILQLAVSRKGILAADESNATISKRFDSIGVKSTVETRRSYRELLFSTPGIEEFISGVIFYEETLAQKNKNGILFTEMLAERGIVPGVKVDKGLSLLPFTEENITQGLDGLAERLQTYKQMGTFFAKWRALFKISPSLPSPLAISANAHALARYAALCQDIGMIPIVEPELFLEGDHSIERCAEVAEVVLNKVFEELVTHKVRLECIILKPSMVLAGKGAREIPSTQEIATETLKVLRRCVPSAVPSINFLSGGQTPEEATAHLNAMNTGKPQPWLISFSYGRALQEYALKSWKGEIKNTATAQQAFYERAKLNSLATSGLYQPTMEPGKLKTTQVI